MNPFRFFLLIAVTLVSVAVSLIAGAFPCLVFTGAGTVLLVSTYRWHWIWFVLIMVATSWVQQFTPMGLTIGQNNLGMVLTSTTVCVISGVFGYFSFRQPVKRQNNLL